MKESTARQKVPGGKLLMVRLTYDDRIESLQILGDFFVVPEDALPKLEGALVGVSVREREDRLSARISNTLAEEGIELIGVNPDAIARTIREALE